MLNTQVDGVKFRERKDKRIEITYPNDLYSPLILSFEEGMDVYKIAFARKYADRVFDNVIKELGLNIKTAHLLSVTDRITKNGTTLTYKYPNGHVVTAPDDIFQVYMERALKQKGIDLSYIKTTTNKYKLDLSGNVGGIAYTYKRFLFDAPWKEKNVDKQALKEYLKSHKNITILEEVRYDRRKVDINKLLETKFGTESEHRGYGSQASIATKTIKLKMDSYGNLLIEHNLEIWD